MRSAGCSVNKVDGRRLMQLRCFQLETSEPQAGGKLALPGLFRFYRFCFEWLTLLRGKFRLKLASVLCTKSLKGLSGGEKRHFVFFVINRDKTREDRFASQIHVSYSSVFSLRYRSQVSILFILLGTLLFFYFNGQDSDQFPR